MNVKRLLQRPSCNAIRRDRWNFVAELGFAAMGIKGFAQSSETLAEGRILQSKRRATMRCAGGSDDRNA